MTTVRMEYDMQTTADIADPIYVLVVDVRLGDRQGLAETLGLHAGESARLVHKVRQNEPMVVVITGTYC